MVADVPQKTRAFYLSQSELERISLGTKVVQFAETGADVALVALEENVQGFDRDGAVRRL